MENATVIMKNGPLYHGRRAVVRVQDRPNGEQVLVTYDDGSDAIVSSCTITWGPRNAGGRPPKLKGIKI